MTDPARKRYSASGASAEKLGIVLEYEPAPDCSGGYCEKVKLTSVDWPTVTAWADGK